MERGQTWQKELGGFGRAKFHEIVYGVEYAAASVESGMFRRLFQFLQFGGVDVIACVDTRDICLCQLFRLMPPSYDPVGLNNEEFEVVLEYPHDIRHLYLDLSCYTDCIVYDAPALV